MGMSRTWSPRCFFAATFLIASLVAAPPLGTTVTGRAHAADVDPLEAAVSQALVDDLGPDAAAIEVHAHAGVVTLAGVVGDAAIRDRAEKTAYGVAAVERVDNRLRVLEPPINPRGM